MTESQTQENPSSNLFGILSCIILFLSVALGAFAAHGLEETLTDRGKEIWNTAVQYQTMHALAMLALFILGLQRPGLKLGQVNVVFLIGIILFSGSLYALALMPQYGFLGAITPFGGLSFLVGWVMAALKIFRIGKEK